MRSVSSRTISRFLYAAELSRLYKCGVEAEEHTELHKERVGRIAQHVARVGDQKRGKGLVEEYIMFFSLCMGNSWWSWVYVRRFRAGEEGSCARKWEAEGPCVYDKIGWYR